MSTENCANSKIKETLKSLCCNNGWCYGAFWGFDQRKSLLLTLKDAYYDEQMGALIDNMLLQVHALGRGVIGQVAFTENHQWIHSDALHERQKSLGSFESLDLFQDDYELYCQFSTGIKTIALISVERWGVVQLGSTHKNPETKEFVDQVKKLFRGMDNELSFLYANDSFALPSQSFPTTHQQMENSLLTASSLIDNPNQNGCKSMNQLEQLLLDSQNFFDCSATQAVSSTSDCSVLTSSYPHFPPGHKENVSFSDNLGFSKDVLFDNQTLTSLLSLDELFQESDFSDANIISKHGLEDGCDLSEWISPQTFTSTLNANLSHASGLGPLGGNFSPINKSENLSTNSLQSSVMDWNETLVPVINVDADLSETDKYVGSKIRGSKSSLFSKLGLDQLLDSVPSTSTSSLTRSRFDDQSSSFAKRRKTDSFSWSHSQVKMESFPSFYGKMKSLNPEMRVTEFNSETYRNVASSCIRNSCNIIGGNASSSRVQDETEKSLKKKKAKPGTKPRPKDRQMIQDRLAELRELIPNGEKMSIDRLLERTIRHLNFMQNLTRHAESLKQIDSKPKSGEVQKNYSSNVGGGVTWACEVGDQTMVCPLIVEDLNTPGQMLIEILCEEQGFFLEIVDIIRGFGLIILKGVMETRNTKKIWAHFLVEAEGTRCVTRHEIFSSLIQLLQMTGQSAKANETDGFENVISSSFNNCQPPNNIQFPVNLGDAIRCANL